MADARFFVLSLAPPKIKRTFSPPAAERSYYIMLKANRRITTAIGAGRSTEVTIDDARKRM